MPTILSAAVMSALLATVTIALAPGTAAAQERRVTINREALTQELIASLERQYRVRLLDGDYWYDRRIGLWGFWGGPAVGLAVPGLDVGGPLAREASGGGTGVLVNGRELHPSDVALLRGFMMVVPGRYWLDSSGWGGFEGGPPLWNLWALASQAQARSGGGGNSWIHRGPGGGMGSDGKCIYYIGREGSASTGC